MGTEISMSSSPGNIGFGIEMSKVKKWEIVSVSVCLDSMVLQSGKESDQFESLKLSHTSSHPIPCPSPSGSISSVN